MAKNKKSSPKKAAAKKSTSNKSTVRKSKRKSTSPGRRLKRSIPMVAAVQAVTAAADVNITFTSGVGQATASLFRNGVLINMQSISQSTTILFSDVQSGDGLAIVGVSSGNTTITISVPTSPRTPDRRPAGPIHRSYIIQ